MNGADKVAAAVAATVLVLIAARPAAAQEFTTTRTKPNIVLLIADDLGWTDLSTGRTTGGHGSKFYQTPNVDRLASEGMSFTSAYANQNCQPSRASLMTGQY
ncbi:MAG: sulfatase-like hydrolase/transferase, partial [Armatimonadota bacterium]